MLTDKEAFDAWACEYYLDDEPLTTLSRRQDCLAAYIGGVARGRTEVLEMVRDKDDVYGIGNMLSQMTGDDIADDIVERLEIGEIVITVPKQPTYTWIDVEGDQHTDVLPLIKG